MTKLCRSGLRVCEGTPTPGFKTCAPCRAQLAENTAAHRARYPEQVKQSAALSMRTRRQKARLEIIERLGGKCTCCGEDHYEFLTVDHTAKNGAEHRRALGLGENGNSNFYTRVIRSGNLDGLQILCANCHNAKDLFGACPHQTGKSIKPQIVQAVHEREAKRKAKK